MLADKKIIEILKSNSIFNETDLANYQEQAETKGLNLEKLLLTSNLVSEDILYNAAATFYSLPFCNLKEKTIEKEVLFLIPEPIAAKYEIIAFAKSDKDLSVAVTDPDDIQTIEFIKRKVNLPLKIFIATPAAIKDTAKQYHANLETELNAIRSKTGGKLAAELKESEAGAPGGRLEDLAKDLPVVRQRQGAGGGYLARIRHFRGRLGHSHRARRKRSNHPLPRGRHFARSDDSAQDSAGRPDRAP